MRVIAVTGLKGGVGKTATAVNLSALAAHQGHRTLLWDLDAQAAATHCFDLRPKLKGGAEKLLGGGRELRAVVKASHLERLDVVPADLSMRGADVLLANDGRPKRLVRRLLAGARHNYDVAVLDCPPGLGPMAEVVASVADLLLVPVIPAPLGLRAFETYVAFVADQVGSAEAVAPFLSLVDRRKPMHRRLEAQARADRRFLRSSIALSSAVERLGEEQVPTVDAAPRSLAAGGYRALWQETAERADVPAA